MLLNNYFIYETQQGPITNVITKLFFVNPHSNDMRRALPHVLLIDTTYKTNIYNMPFVQGVGLTSTEKSLSIMHAVICKEQNDNFVWVLEKIRSMLNECLEPRVIVMDKELALMNACAKAFPKASRYLCRFNIQ
ncbi:putative MULE transposase domain, FHY3/FAR1 family [Helianthus annuus]|nr:putative MULE transposase domain, FHY3/FAR1 family [Helianthus annuus]